jgi:hypothetical protein
MSNKEKNKESKYKEKLENFINIEAVAEIFSKNKKIDDFKPENGENPILVVVVGAPGVGKTTQTRKFLAERGLEYNNFYNVSLDSLVENILPYRKATKNLYNKVKSKKISEKSNNKALTINNKNSISTILSNVYLRTIMTKKSNFELPSTISRIKNKVGIQNNTTTISPSIITTEYSLLEKLNEGLKYGIDNGLNIIYDTTIVQNNNNTNKIIDKVIPMLNEAEKNKIYYNVKVILIFATEEDIRKRIHGRQNEMLKENEPYIRAINPYMTTDYIYDNINAFIKTAEYFGQKPKIKKGQLDSLKVILDSSATKIKNKLSTQNTNLTNKLKETTNNKEITKINKQIDNIKTQIKNINELLKDLDIDTDGKPMNNSKHTIFINENNLTFKKPNNIPPKYEFIAIANPQKNNTNKKSKNNTKKNNNNINNKTKKNNNNDSKEFRYF